MNLPSLILVVILAAAFAAALWRSFSPRRRGGCGGSCRTCSAAGKPQDLTIPCRKL